MKYQGIWLNDEFKIETKKFRKNSLLGAARNFKKYPKSDVDSLNIPYDYASIMHYPEKAFTKNGKYTIVPKKNGVGL
jgi:hypothetical protein